MDSKAQPISRPSPEKPSPQDFRKRLEQLSAEKAASTQRHIESIRDTYSKSNRWGFRLSSSH